jgi:hypothetical protein
LTAFRALQWQYLPDRDRAHLVPHGGSQAVCGVYSVPATTWRAAPDARLAAGMRCCQTCTRMEGADR